MTDTSYSEPAAVKQWIMETPVIWRRFQEQLPPVGMEITVQDDPLRTLGRVTRVRRDDLWILLDTSNYVGVAVLETVQWRETIKTGQ